MPTAFSNSIEDMAGVPSGMDTMDKAPMNKPASVDLAPGDGTDFRPIQDNGTWAEFSCGGVPYVPGGGSKPG
jgi:hypothetical protein